MRQGNEREDQAEGVQAVVIPILMCGAETWELKKAQENKLEVAEMEVEVVWASGEKRMSTRPM